MHLLGDRSLQACNNGTVPGIVGGVRTVSAGSPEPSDATRSFDELYRSELTPLTRVATLLVGSSPLAEDIVHDAFEVVQRRWPDLDRPGGYLRTTVVNACRMALRHREVERRYQARLLVPGGVPAEDELVDLRDALASLSERQRLVVVLRYVDGATDDEIASALGCRPATVRSSASRALARLQKELS